MIWIVVGGAVLFLVGVRALVGRRAVVAVGGEDVSYEVEPGQAQPEPPVEENYEEPPAEAEESFDYVEDAGEEEAGDEGEEEETEEGNEGDEGEEEGEVAEQEEPEAPAPLPASPPGGAVAAMPSSATTPNDTAAEAASAPVAIKAAETMRVSARPASSMPFSTPRPILAAKPIVKPVAKRVVLRPAKPIVRPVARPVIRAAQPIVKRGR